MFEGQLTFRHPAHVVVAGKWRRLMHELNSLLDLQVLVDAFDVLS